MVQPAARVFDVGVQALEQAEQPALLALIQTQAVVLHPQLGRRAM